MRPTGAHAPGWFPRIAPPARNDLGSLLRGTVEVGKKSVILRVSHARFIGGLRSSGRQWAGANSVSTASRDRNVRPWGRVDSVGRISPGNHRRWICGRHSH
jgi:hypothetical protein